MMSLGTLQQPGQNIVTAIVPLKVGDTCSFTKTVSELDVYLFAGITGDFSQV